MSVSADPPPAFAHGADPDQPTCERCGHDLQDDQEWCLECGCARTLIHRPPGWRFPLALIATVVVVVLAGFAIALIKLSSDANRSAAAEAPTRAAPAPASTPASTSGAAPATPTATPKRRIPGWPHGLPGWTVSVESASTGAAARAGARQIVRAGLRPGVLSTSLHPSMTPGSFIVFIGRYRTETAAQDRARKLIARGYPNATAVLVGRPGG